MNASRGEPEWSEVDDLFRRALEIPVPGRTQYVADETRGAPALRAAVEELLGSSDAAEGFLEVPAVDVARLELDGLYSAVRDEAPGGSARPGKCVADHGRAGERVGPYRLLGRLGRGGMATVYAAERADGQWEQTVALKLIRRGLDTDDLVRRFIAERQILSSLEHPCIARLLDGGSTDRGDPYLAMELVDGEPITAYCDDRRVRVPDRLRLFCKVGRAVQYAHRSLVVHRDLKPSNILVDRAGEPKLLDFGIAKMLSADPEEGAHTRTGRSLLTPDYASPEQLRGGRITTATDVYQLSVLLCVLSTGQLPWGRADADGSLRALPGETAAERFSDESLRPSRLVTEEAARARGSTTGPLIRALRGDLGAIIEKGLRPRPEDRYVSVEALVDDVERMLAGRPVLARDGAWAYRATKLVRRKPWLPIAAGAVLVAALGYGFTLTRHADQLEVERNAAREQAARAEQAQAFLVDVFRSADPYGEDGPEITLVEALDRGVDRIRAELEGEALVQASLLGAVADVFTNLGLADSAVSLHAEAAALLLEAREVDEAARVDRLRMLGRSLLESNRLDSAEAVLSRALDIARELPGGRPDLEVHVLHQWGRVAVRTGAYEEAERRLLLAQETARTVDPFPVASEASTLLELASIYPHLNDTVAALRSAEEGLRLSRLTFGDTHATTAIAMAARADALRWSGRDEDAVDAYGEAIDHLTDAFGPESPEVLNARQNLALQLSALGELHAAEEELRRLLALHRARTGPSSTEVGAALQNLASNLKQQERLGEALPLLAEAHEVLVRTLEAGHYLTAFPLLTRAEIELSRDDFEAAERSSRQASEILARTLPEGHYARAVADCRVGRALFGMGQTEAGRGWMERASKAMEQAPATPAAYRAECYDALQAAAGMDTPG
ncbi:MAG: serine/threonine-protein kinase [Gemmatimonadota bacterium]